MVGDTGPGGGKVFYIAGPTRYEAASTDLGTAPWGCQGTSVPGAVATAVGTGAANTTAIVGVCLTAGIAARLADDYVSGGQTDWFLPSKDELNELYLQKATVGGFADDVYWSSSEFAPTAAWFQHFGDGSQDGGTKPDSYYVRPVRAF